MASQYPVISRDNNFDVVRLFAALQVCTGHILLFFNLSEHVGPVDRLLSYFPGVIIFFAISGFLVTASWCRSRSVRQYARNRFFRIFPALFVSFVILQLVLLLFGYLSLSSLGDGQIWVYWLGQLTMGQFFTPDSLRGFGVGMPNTSLWTIPVEIEFYILLPVMFIFLPKVRMEIKILFLFICSIVANILLARSGVIPNASTNAADLMTKMSSGDIELLIRLGRVTVVPYLYCFLFGSYVYLCWDRLKRLFVGKALYWLLVYGVVLLVFDCGPSYEISSTAGVICNLLLGCLAISSAFSFGNIYNLLNGIDISYGLYVIHMIVLNVFIEFGFDSSILHGVLAFMSSLILAFIMYRYVERPALRLKDCSWRGEVSAIRTI